MIVNDRWLAADDWKWAASIIGDRGWRRLLAWVIWLREIRMFPCLSSSHSPRLKGSSVTVDNWPQWLEMGKCQWPKIENDGDCVWNRMMERQTGIIFLSLKLAISQTLAEVQCVWCFLSLVFLQALGERGWKKIITHIFYYFLSLTFSFSPQSNRRNLLFHFFS